MPNAVLRAVGGSVVVELPKPSLERLNLRAGSRVRIEVDRDKVTLTPISKPRYTLAALLAQCDFSKRSSHEERAWQSAKPVGKEII
jgi:antitoxin ChpS